MQAFNWTCPHCAHKVTITKERYSLDRHLLHIENSDGSWALQTRYLVCPNKDCRKVTLDAMLFEWEYKNNNATLIGNPIKVWKMVPASNCRAFPDYVPASIRQDYEESCLVRDLSPKASATLARRALQGILRGFYQVTPGRLFDEINALEESMEPDVWNAIHAVRKVGNIGAHMQADIDVIVEVDPDEAGLLIELVETMVEETYIRREQRQERLRRVTELADQKDQERKRPRQAIPVGQDDSGVGDGEEAAENV